MVSACLAQAVLEAGSNTTPIELPEQLMERLYREQLELTPQNRYLIEHAAPLCVKNQVRTFHWYQQFLPETGSILDWGCCHAPDSCLLRQEYESTYHLFGCDFFEPGRFGVFHDFAGLNYSMLPDHVELPYPDGHFDCIIAGGVLEHAVMDYESLKSLYRTLKPGGILIITYLPNWLSVKEWTRRVIHKKDYHNRLYGLGETRQLLKRAGFLPIAARHQTFFRESLASAAGLSKWEEAVSTALTPLLPIAIFNSVLCFAARKVTAM